MEIDVKSAVAEIESTTDLLERALKLSGLVTTMFQRRGFPLVVVGGSAVEFYTEGGYMSGDIDFEENLQRCICLDTRYLLFVIDKYAGCHRLIEEMDIVTK
jgi:hypothetical protein